MENILKFRSESDYQLEINFNELINIKKLLSSDDLDFYNNVFIKITTDQTRVKTSFKKAFKTIDRYCFLYLEQQEDKICTHNFITESRQLIEKLTKRELLIVMMFVNRWQESTDCNPFYSMNKDLEYYLLSTCEG